ncbi:MAG: Lrp/AsnC family transcriptional regulator [Thermoplasmata archaeon]
MGEAAAEWDDLDLEILRLLNRDARQSYRDLARQLQISTSTVSTRIRRLEEEGIITGYAPIIDQERTGFDLPVVVGLQISKGRLLEVQQKVAEDPRVYGVYDVTGDWDSIVMARFRNTRDLDAFIKRVLALPYVERTYTQLVLNTVKEEKRVLL